MIREIDYPVYTTGPVASMSWGAVWAASFVGVASAALLGLLAESVGLSNVTTPWGAAFLILSACVSYYSAGWIAGRMTRSGVVGESVIHGLTAWAVITTVFGVAHYAIPGGATEARQLNGLEAFLFGGCALLSSAVGGAQGTRLLRLHPIAAATSSVDVRERVIPSRR